MTADGDDVEVAKVIQKAQVRFQEQANVSVIHWQHSKPQAISNAYEALAIHYGWALQKLFSNASLDEPNDSPFPRRVLILEEDLHVAPDFFDYFTSMAPILDQDSSVYAVSAFNDNGFRGKVKDVTRVLRTDFFPGLGWMMTRRLWEEELQQKWPRIYWDGWLRLGAQRKGRHTLRPEVSRTFHFGTMGGASGNQYGGLLQRIQLNSERVDWSKRNLTNLSITDEYDRQYWKLIRSAKRVQTREEALQHCNATNVLIEYKDLEDFRIVAKDLELMVDNKDGILRTSYKGVVETRPCGNNLLFLTPPFDELRRSFQLVANM
ncbi:hypothetical protein MPSEU_000187000 [Mayamaea pseudoterrestris]|nr:hypothetical protein MPSEU_000187000 [Mayamaea pseudoterrestris]